MYGKTPSSWIRQGDWKLIHWHGDYLDSAGFTPDQVPYGKLVLVLARNSTMSKTTSASNMTLPRLTLKKSRRSSRVSKRGGGRPARNSPPAIPSSIPSSGTSRRGGSAHQQVRDVDSKQRV